MSNQPPTVVADTATDTLRHPSPRVFDALAHSRRRALISILVARQRPISEHDLATQIAAREQEKPLADVTTKEQQEIQLSLAHRHLPKLEKLGLIEHDHDGGTVVNTSVDFESMGLLGVAAGHNGAQSGSVDTRFAAFAHDRRWVILSVLEDRRESHSDQRVSITVEELTEAVVDREHERSPSEFADEGATRIALSLQHQHLPKLADTELITYDRDHATITYEGHPALRNGVLSVPGQVC